MSEQKKFLLRKVTGDQTLESEQEIRSWFQRGQCKAADLLFDFATRKWSRVGDHAALASLLPPKPTSLPERKLIYVLNPSSSTPIVQGPYSTKDLQQLSASRELCESSWVYVDGDKEWRQIRSVKALADMLGALPTDIPAQPATALTPPGLPLSHEPPQIALNQPTSPSIQLDVPTGEFQKIAEAADDHVEKEEETKAVSVLGLSLTTEEPKGPPKPPGKPTVPPPPAAAARPPLPPKRENTMSLELPADAAPVHVEGERIARETEGSFDGITAEISPDPIWMIKGAENEAISGPFRFLEVLKYIEEGRITRNDKVSRVGSNRFVKIAQQYEFNVKFTLETKVERGVEKQKILIKRRHPRVPYITGVQVVGRQGTMAGSCVNISAGGILMEIPKAEFNLGDVLEIKLMPGLIERAISCRALVIGKIPKIPPGYALRFEQLKNEDKEAIEYFVQEALKREMINHG